MGGPAWKNHLPRNNAPAAAEKNKNLCEAARPFVTAVAAAAATAEEMYLFLRLGRLCNCYFIIPDLCCAAAVRPLNLLPCRPTTCSFFFLTFLNDMKHIGRRTLF